MNCYHCRNEIPPGTEIVHKIKEQEELFCCNGCKLVAEFIIGSGKEAFYDLRGSSTLEPYQEQDEYTKDSLNSEFTYEEFVTGKDASCREVFITITNIHCSACVWLNEKVLLEKKGIKQVRINFANARAHIVWDDTTIQLYDIIETIKSIGYKPILYAPWKKEKQFQSISKDLFMRMLVSGFCFGNIMMVSAALYAGYFTGIDWNFKRLFHYLSWLLATPAYLYSGIPFIRSAFYALKNKSLNMDILLVTGISLAYFYSVYVTITDIGEVYFDSVCMIYFFILLGKYFEALTRSSASRKINLLLSKLPEVSTVIVEGQEKKKLSSTLKPEEVVLVIPGERIPVDGELLIDNVYIDESFLTGESRPIIKQKGDKLFAGSLCVDKSLYMRSLTSYNNSTLSFLQRLVENAMMEKPAIQRITDRIASGFIKTVLVVSILTFIGWMLYSGNIEKSLINTIAVLIVACPCALGLSVPITLVIGNLILSEKGIILKNPDLIDKLSKIDAVLLDKTGTITEGNLKVIEENILGDKSLVYQLVYAIEKNSLHPIAKSIFHYIQQQLKDVSKLNFQQTYIEEIGGKGIKGQVVLDQDVYEIYIGNQELIETITSQKVVNEATNQQEGTIVFIAINKQYNGYWTLKDTLRKEAKEELARLKSFVPEQKIISGDRTEAVRSIANELEITDWKAVLKPEDKLKEVESLQSNQKTIMMVGDGINDAGALAKADVSVTLQIASDLSIDKSDVILMQNNLAGLRLLVIYSQMTYRVIRQNIGLSFMYNSVMLPLAAFGYMLPVLCAVFMTLSSITVIINSFLLKFRAGKIQ